jgi:hypothetical protein
MMDALTYLRTGGTLEDAAEIGDALRERGPADRIERAVQILTDGARIRSLLRDPENDIRNKRPGAEALAPALAIIRQGWAREIAAADAHGRRCHRRLLERAHERLRCPKRAARARAFHEWLRPELRRHDRASRVFYFGVRALDVGDRDLIDACEGGTGNFGGTVHRHACGAFVTLYTD